MFTAVHPKLPMRDKSITKEFYLNKLGFQLVGDVDFDRYLMIQKDGIQLHFFEFKDLNPEENYGQIYIRSNRLEEDYQTLLDAKVRIHPNGQLQSKPWGQKEFSILDPDKNLLTFGNE